MSGAYNSLLSCFKEVEKRAPFVPGLAVVLGSGLGSFAENLNIEAAVPYDEISGFPVSTVRGHAGRFLFAKLQGIPTVFMQGRVHYYEGYSMEQVVLPIRLMGLLGAKTVLLTNAAGAVNRNFRSGDLMLITGQISSFVPSPLRGENMDALGTRFPDMSSVYSASLQQKAVDTAKKLDIPLQKGVYLQTPGPQYETPQEIKMYGLLGADAVGMSTAVEAIAARHMGMTVCGLSCITNMAAGIAPAPLSHSEVQAAAVSSAESFGRLVTALAPALAGEGKQ